MKTICFFYLFVVMINTAGAQESKFLAGIEGGPSNTFLRGNEILKKWHQPDTRFTAGVFFQFNFRKFFSVRTGALYQDKGSVIKGPFPDGKSETIGTSHFQYLSIPLLLRATFGKKIIYFVNAGPSLECLLSAWNQIEMAPAHRENLPDFNTVDFGLTGGIGIGVPLCHSILISLEARNNLGLTNISQLPAGDGGSIKTNSAALLIGISKKFGYRQPAK
jgi:hypothetical protein